MGDSISIFRRGLFAAALFFLMMSAGQIAAQTRSFDLEAGNSRTTLREFARQALVDVVMDRRDVQGVQTNEVSGLLEPRIALVRMLEGTPLVFKEDLESGAFAVTRSEIPSPDQTTQNTEPQILEETEMNIKQNNWLKTLVAALTLGILGGQGGLSAQEEGELEKIYELSPFTIDEAENVGYLATQTLAGTRLKTELRDIAATISVVTKELMEDTGSSTMEDILIYTPNAEVTGAGGNFANINSGRAVGGVTEGAYRNPDLNTRIRGLAAANLTREYFSTRIGLDTYNTQQVVINRGANSILFGLGSPAGNINTSLIQPVFANRQELDVRAGSYGTVRASIDMEQVLVEDKLSARFAALYNDRQYQQSPAFERDKRFYGVLAYRPFESTLIKVSGEAGTIDANRPRTIPPNDMLTHWWDEGPNRPWQTAPDPTLLPGVRQPTHDPSSISGAVLPNPNGTDSAVYWGPPAWAWNPFLVYESNSASTDSSLADGIPDGIQGWIHPSHGINAATGIANANFVTLRGTNQTLGFSNEFDQNGNSIALTRDFYTNDVIQDTSVYDFKNLLLDGPNKAEGQSFDVINASIEQTFLDNNAGLEYSFNREESKNTGSGLLGAGARWYALQIDPNTHFHDGTVNPNFGRVMVSTLTNTTPTTESHHDFETHRLTGFLKFDLSEKVDGWLGSLLGNHTITGLLESHSSQSSSFSYRDYVFADDFASFIGPRGNNIFGIDRQVSTAIYLGPSLANASSASEANLSNIKEKIQIPSDATLRVFNRDTLLLEDHAFRIDGPIGVGGSHRKVEIDTKAIVLHSKLLDDHIVGTFGWREDSYDVWSTTNPPRGLDGRRLLSPEEFKLPDEKTFSDSPQNTTWGVVAHIPDSIMENIAGGLGFSLHVSESENSQVGQSRIDFNGNRLAPVSGTTEEYGFSFSALNDRLYLRANWYETSQLDGNSGLGGQFLQIINHEAAMIANIPDVIAQNPLNQPDIEQVAQFPSIPDNLVSLLNLVIDQDSGLVTSSPPSGLTSTADNASEGFELELGGNLTDNWSIVLNAAKQKVVSQNTAPLLQEYVRERRPIWEQFDKFPRNVQDPNVGILGAINTQALVPALIQINQDGAPRADEVREWRINLITNYRFDAQSKFRGWNIGGAARWQDDVGIGFPIVNDPELGTISDVTSPFFGPDELNVDGWIGYQRLIWDNKVNWKLQLNIRNLFDDDDLIPVVANPNGTIPVVRIPAERTWEIRSTFQF